MIQLIRQTCWLLILVIGLASIPAAVAQPRFPGQDLSERKRYVHFPIDPNYEKELKERLGMEHELAPFKELIKKLLADPKGFDLRMADLKDIKSEDPKFKDAVENWLKRDGKLRESLLDWIRKQPADKQPEEVKKLHAELKDIVEDIPAMPPDQALQPKPIEPIHNQEDSFARLTERAMKQAEDGEFGKWLQESPSWQRAFEDLRGTLREKQSQDGALGDWQSQLVGPDGALWRMAENTLERLRDSPRPKLNRFKHELSIPGVGNIPLPDLGPPGSADLGSDSLSTIGTVATWAMGALIALLLLTRLIRWKKRTLATPSTRPDLGPWPVRPEAVRTRADLIAAFDYLALWTLGLAVKSWNHHAVARQWCHTAPDCAESAGSLASLYEEARYTAGAEELPSLARDRARQSLLRLAEAI